MDNLDKNALERMNLKELKKLALEKNINFKNNIKKNELIELIAKNTTKILAEIKTKKTKNKPISNSTTLKLQKEKKQDIQRNNEENKFEKSKYYEEKVEIKEQNQINKLPERYNTDKLIFLPIDPYRGFLYWELSDALIKKYGFNNEHFDKILRVYELEKYKKDDLSDYIEIHVNKDANNWYLNFKSPDKHYIAELGFIKDGKYIKLLTSNEVYAPRDNVSNQLDELWMLKDDKYKLLLEASGIKVLFTQTGSVEIMKFVTEKIPGSMSSTFK